MSGLPPLRDRVALVTGASSGIGAALALRMAAEGARLALVARRVPALEAVAARVRASGSEALVVPCDVSDVEQVARAAHEVLAHYGRVDLLVNNAGYGRHREFADWDVADMERMMRVNYLGALYFTKAVLPSMVERRSGWLVFMASVAGRIGLPDESAYAASKFALVGLAESLSIELEDRGVRVLTVCPGAIRTPFFDEEALRRLPPVALRSMGKPEALVDAIVNALARGRRELTFPRSLAVSYLVKAVAPGFLRRQVHRVTLGARARARERAGDLLQGGKR